MKKQNITVIQLFTMIVLFELGSAVVIGVGLEAKQDVWLVILIGTISGILLFSLYTFLSKENPDLTLVGILKARMGKIAGTILSFIYIAYFIYIASRVLRDLGDLIITALLAGTPMLAVNIVIILTVIYGCYLGLEVIGRMSEIYFPWVMLFGGLLLSLIYIAGLPELKNLQPQLSEGLLPVLKATYPEVITFPFGEIIVFAMFFPFIHTPDNTKKAGVLAILFSGFILIIVNMTIISVLGGYAATSSTIPLLEAISKVNIGNFIQRLDPLVIIVLIVCGFFKVAIFTYSSIIGLKEIVNFKIKHFYYLPIGFFILVLSIGISEDTVEHLQVGLKIVPYYMHLPLQIGVPVLLLLLIFIKSKLKKNDGVKDSA